MVSSAFKRFEIIAAVCSFVAGVVIYLLWRDQQLLIHRVLNTCGLQPSLDLLRCKVADIQIPEWIRFALPDGLWSLSYILIIDALVKRGYLWTSVIPVIGVISEFMQLVGWLPGTFDIADFLAYSIPYLLYICLIKQTKNINRI